ncbi:MAG TPA: substrate-binding domain-containing protein [Xanthobacteraceae bacterium]|nr:substrate-binding domain-containing protein [Xanthobacteraceae bacterium]
MATHALTAAAVGLAIALGSGPATAAEITSLVSNAFKTSFPDLTPLFEKATEHRLKTAFGSTDPLKVRIEKGEPIDLAIIGEGAIDELIKQGKLVAATRVVVARSGLGVAVRKGAPKPDLSTTEAFKRTIVNAQSIGFNAGGLSGIYLWSLFDKLGLTAVVKAKFKDGSGATMAATGATEIGLTQASEVGLVPEAELAGRLPAEIQHFTVFPAAISVNAKAPDAAQALLKFLASPDALRVMRAKGLEPPA